MMTELLQKLLHDLVSRKGVQHAIMAVRRGDDSFQWIGAVGDASPDGTPMRAGTPYFLASVDKLFTAAVTLKLCERGHVELDCPIIAYLTERLVGGIHRLGGVDYSGKLTVRHLLSHTSGLADWLEDRPKAGQSLIESLVSRGDMSLGIDDIVCIVRDRLTPHFPPQPVEAKRPKVRYSDTNYMLLIAMIEAVTGRSLAAVHDELLFRPLDLRHTWLAGHSQPHVPTPEPAAIWFGREPLEIPLLLRSTWAIYSTAEDTLRFMRALTRGDIFDSPATQALMMQRWNRFGLPTDRAALRLPSWPIEYGLGMMRFHDPILRLTGRLPRILRPIYPAPAVIGHTGSTGSWLFHCPQLDLLLSGTVNQAAAGAMPFRLVGRTLRIVDEYRQS